MLEKPITFDRFIRGLLIALLVIAVLYAVSHLSSVLLPFFIAWFLAYLTYPLVVFIQNKLHVRVRALAIILAMLLVIAIVGLIIYLIIPPMIEQISKVGDLVQRYLQHTTHTNDLWATVSAWLQENQGNIEHFIQSKDFTDALKTAMPKVFTSSSAS